MKVVGVDPGGRDSGVVLRSRNEVERVAVVHLADDQPRPTGCYLLAVLVEIVESCAIGRSATGRRPLIALENINKPSAYLDGELHTMNPEHLIGVSMVFGAVVAIFQDDVVIVPPGKHGKKALKFYPPELVGGPHNPSWPHAEPQGTGILRHARSAWDIALAGLYLARGRGLRTAR